MSATSLALGCVEALLPSLCVSCDGVLAGHERGLCAGCWSAMIPVAGWRCPLCAGPTDAEQGSCLACSSAPPPQAATVVWGEHDGVLRRALVALKHHGHDELAGPLALRLAGRLALEEWADEVDLVTAVPSHRLRRLRRGWVAAELVGRRVATTLGLRFAPTLRRRGLARQTGRSRAERLALPTRSFLARAQVTGRRVLVVDDVTTTGTTLRRAATALLSAGADEAYCAALAAAPDPRRRT